MNIGQLSNKSVKNTLDFFKSITLSKTEEKIAKNVLRNIIDRLEFLSGVGLDYMTIARKSNTLSG